MILTYLGKTVELKIPKTTLRLKQDIVNRLYDQAMIDQPVVPIYENEKFIQQVIQYENTKNIIVEDNVNSKCLSFKISTAVIPNIEVIFYIIIKYKNFIII